jgi:hypothetical protein
MPNDHNNAPIEASTSRPSAKPSRIFLAVGTGAFLLAIWFFICAWLQLGGYGAIGLLLHPLVVLGVLCHLFWWRYVTQTVWLPLGFPLLCVYVRNRIVGTRSLLADCVYVGLAYLLVGILTWLITILIPANREQVATEVEQTHPRKLIFQMRILKLPLHVQG